MTTNSFMVLLLSITNTNFVLRNEFALQKSVLGAYTQMKSITETNSIF